MVIDGRLVLAGVEVIAVRSILISAEGQVTNAVVLNLEYNSSQPGQAAGD